MGIKLQPNISLKMQHKNYAQYRPLLKTKLME